jgi:Flp pilus assembly protein TadB
VTALVAALAAAAVLSGLLLVGAGLRRVPAETGGRPGSPRLARLRRRLAASTPGTGTGRDARRRRLLLVLAAAGGMLGWLLTGLALMVLAVPLAVVGLPRLLRAPASAARVDRLEALEEWTRNLAGVLAVGVGLEQAITASLRSAPEPIRPQVATLVARLAARWQTDAALRAFAADLDDATGDLVAASLILSARRRGAGLVAVLEGLAASVAEDVRARRAIEADRAKPRATARAVTYITVGVLVLLAMNRTYVEPYTSPSGQLLLAVLLSAYIATLLWMRQMITGRPAPRFLGDHSGFTKSETLTLPAGPAQPSVLIPQDRASTLRADTGGRR